MLTRDSVLGHVQALFGERLVVFLGSGSSAPYGLPTMAQLCDEIIARIDDSDGHLRDFDEASSFRETLAANRNLEADLSTIQNGEFLSRLTDAIADCIGQKETEAFGIAVEQPMHLELLVTEALKIPSRLNIVTTNYDRLAEFSAEKAGYPVNSSFVGSYCGAHAPGICASMHVSQSVVSTPRKRIQTTQSKHVCVYKPHGSLGWFDVNGEVRESSFSLPFRRKVIAPTEGKFREGYEEIYSFHRNGANEAIKNASALLVIGYGFWDGHLHQTLVNAIQSGVPTVILTRSIRDFVEGLARGAPNCLLLGKGANGTTRCIHSSQPELEIPESLWDIRSLLYASFSTSGRSVILEKA